jgi:ABC-type sugar transport system substrate-binding protein
MNEVSQAGREIGWMVDRHAGESRMRHLVLEGSGRKRQSVQVGQGMLTVAEQFPQLLSRPVGDQGDHWKREEGLVRFGPFLK